MKINPEELEKIANSGIEIKYDRQGQPRAWKGSSLPDWFDGYSECLKENQFQARRDEAKARGLNEHFQTPDQEKAFKKRQQVQLARKEKAELGLEIANQNK